MHATYFDAVRRVCAGWLHDRMRVDEHQIDIVNEIDEFGKFAIVVAEVLAQEDALMRDVSETNIYRLIKDNLQIIYR
jgi:hypothetical protein